jgi:hypothetical protein
MDMPDGEFEVVALFTGQGLGGRVWRSLTEPRLRFSDTFYRSGESTRDWMVDGETVASRAEADKRLKSPPRLGTDEQTVLASIGAEWTAYPEIALPGEGDWGDPSRAARRDEAVDALIIKGLIDAGAEGVRLYRAPQNGPPADRGALDAFPDPEFRRILCSMDGPLRLVPVIAWPDRFLPAHMPAFRGRIDIDRLSDDSHAAQIVFSQIRDPDALTGPHPLAGGCILMNGNATVFEPTRLIGLGDIAAWQAATRIAGSPDALQDARTGWIRVDVGDALVALQDDDVVYLGRRGAREDLLLPDSRHVIWRMSLPALRATVEEAARTIDRFAETLHRVLDYTPEARRNRLVAWMVRPA